MTIAARLSTLTTQPETDSKKSGDKGHSPKKKKNQNSSNIFSRSGEKLQNFGNKADEILKTLLWKRPDPESIVKLKGGEEVNEMRNTEFLGPENFRLQIGKMQSDGNTIYSPLMLQFGLEYMVNHAKNGKDGKVIIQLRPDLAQLLLQEDKEILSFDEEKKEIMKLVKKLGKKGKIIEIQNVADNYKDVFEALQDGKNGIIKEEPDLKKMKLPIQSPLEIIKYLAYHASKNDELMNLFYYTKPEKYIGQDLKKGVKPGESDADYYSIVEVGIRLFEILNGISIQGGIGRQRVYDRIISLILFGEDRIGTSAEYGIDKPLNIEKYPQLKDLHDKISGYKEYSDKKMQQLYIEVNEKQLGKMQEKVSKKDKYRGRAMVAAMLTTGAILGGSLSYNQHQQNQLQEQEKKEQMATQKRSNKRVYYLNSIHFYKSLQEVESIGLRAEHEKCKLLCAYNISKYNYQNEYGVIENDILKRYHEEQDAYYRLTGELLTAEDFIKGWTGVLINDFDYSYQRPYEILKTIHKSAIQNTLKYGKSNVNRIYKEKEQEQTLFYFIDENEYEYKTVYELKFVTIYTDEGEKEIILAAPVDTFTGEYINEGENQLTLESNVTIKNEINGTEGDFTIQNGIKCLENLQKNYGLEIN